MKIRLQLESSDLREMLDNYFNSNGFSVLNTEELCAQFAAAFPEGLVVAATLAPTRAAPALEAALPPENDYPVEATATPKNVVSLAGRGKNPPLRAADLLDPTNYGDVPRKSDDDESPIDAELEMRRLLAASSQIQAEKERDDAGRRR
jgi:hypothetical protein